MAVTSIGRAVLAVGLIACALLPTPSAAQTADTTPAPPPAPGESAALDSARAARGKRMSVAIYTYGPGAFVFEKFGHIALALTDSTTGEDIAFNWGMFSFEEPNFLWRFLTGDTRYWMEGYRVADFNAAYRAQNRSIRKLSLRLTAEQRGAIADYVRWNAQEANKYYRYDYYADNCATRVRDLLSWALKGQFDEPFQSLGSGRTWRNETARITAGDPLVYPGIQIALGRRADQPLTKWEESFLPELLADHLAALTVTDARGAAVKLVTSDSVLFASDQPAMPKQAPSRVPGALTLGLVFAALIVFTTGLRAAAVRLMLAGIAAVWFTVGALLGTALLLAGTVTKHAPYMGDNLSVLQLHPLMFVAAVVVPVALWRGVRSRVAVGVSSVVALLSLIGVALHQVPAWSQHSGVVLAVVVPVQVAFAIAMLRLPLHLPSRAARAR